MRGGGGLGAAIANGLGFGKNKKKKKTSKSSLRWTVHPAEAISSACRTLHDRVQG